MTIVVVETFQVCRRELVLGFRFPGVAATTAPRSRALFAE